VAALQRRRRRFLRIVAIAGKDQWDAMFNRFRALRDGVDLR